MASQKNNSPVLNRQQKLISALENTNLAGIALNPGPSLTYLTGMHFHLSERPIVAVFAPNSTPLLVLPELESAKTVDLPYDLKTFTYGEDPNTWPGAFEQAAKSVGFIDGQIGVEALSMRVLELHYLEAVLPEINFVAVEEIIGQLRMYKDAEEIAAMRKAVSIAEKAMQATIPQIRIGMSERDLAAELTSQLFKHKSDPTLPFPPIVSGGPNSANPHAFPSDRQLTSGDLLVIDWGASFGGYFSDMTRTFGVGEVNEEFAKIHQLVQDANAAARAAVSPGTTCSDVDKAARAVIEVAGYGEYFFHRTGHGLGMEVHEAPYIRADNLRPLEPGMTFTIEPGIYLPDRGGVRIEDNMLVTEDGTESFTGLPRELVIVG
ncbi:MAG: aminopeptidase P family protein [Chloroflexi bacterium]|nr:aminopeptidase P family protein [Chloroflexota bacterium]